MEKACGLDAHKDSLFACILDEQGNIFLEKRYVGCIKQKRKRSGCIQSVVILFMENTKQ